MRISTGYPDPAGSNLAGTFHLEITWTDSFGGEHRGNFEGAGNHYKTASGDGLSSEANRSAQKAFYAAFLNAANLISASSTVTAVSFDPDTFKLDGTF